MLQQSTARYHKYTPITVTNNIYAPMVNTLTSQSWQWHYQRMEQFQRERRQIHFQNCRYKFSML